MNQQMNKDFVQRLSIADVASGQIKRAQTLFP